MFRESVKLISNLAGTDWTYLDRPNIPPHEYDKIFRKRFLAIFTFFLPVNFSVMELDKA